MLDLISKNIVYRETAIVFSIKLVGIALNFLFFYFLAKQYGEEEFGLFSLSLTVLNIASTVSLVGIDTAVLKFLSSEDGSDNGVVRSLILKCTTTVCILAVCVCAVLLSLSEFFSVGVFKNGKFEKYFITASFCIIPFSMFRLACRILRGRGFIVAYALFQHVSIFMLAILAALVAWRSNFTGYIAGWSYYISILTTTVLIIAYIIFKFYQKLYLAPSTSLSKIITTSLPMLLTSASALFLSWCDIVVLGIYRPESEVGIYSISAKFSFFSTLGLMVVSAITAPKFSRYYSSNNRLEIEKIIRSSGLALLLLTVPILVALVVFSPTLLSFLGGQYTLAYTPLLILLVGHAYHALCGPCGSFLNMTGNQNSLALVIFFTAVINVFLNVLLVQPYGMVGVAVATTVSWMLSNSIVTLLIYRNTDFLFPMASLVSFGYKALFR